ncbi:FecR family protein [Reyranella sp.]|uniref:FecR family protein n=1 Tax=Reyranella sp. TaxID=1929291 RepID=UPI003BAC2644
MAVSPTDLDRAEGEATDWLMRLSEGGGDAELRAAFEAWRAASPLNAQSWDRARLAYELIGRHAPRHAEHWQPRTPQRSAGRPFPAAAAPGPSRARAPAARAARRWRIAAGLAAAAWMALIVTALLPGWLLRLEADVVTETAEVRSLVLADGSRVQLGPESAVELSVGPETREVRLLKGEAFFEVVPDRSRPFRVEAGDASITVLGTAFEVRLDDAETLVAVQEGRVRVEGGRALQSGPAFLEAGAIARIRPGYPIEHGAMKPDDVAPWRRGELVAMDRPAGEIVAELRRYHAGLIVVQSGAFASRRVSGIYDLKDPASTLRGVAASHGASVHQLSPWLLVVVSAGP